LLDIKTLKDFEVFESLPLSYKYNNVVSVKEIFDIKNDKI